MRLNINFEGTSQVLTWIQQIIQDTFNINPVTIKCMGNYYSMDWTSSGAIKLYLALKQFIEINNLPALERKWNKDLSILCESKKYAVLLGLPVIHKNILI
jgi:hypothetical protein